MGVGLDGPGGPLQPYDSMVLHQENHKFFVRTKDESLLIQSTNVKVELSQVFFSLFFFGIGAGALCFRNSSLLIFQRV